MIKHKSIYAFTLIEILVVIAIIGILAGIMVPSYAKSKAEANLTACEQNLREIAVAANTFLVRHHGSEVRSCIGVEALVDSGYLQAEPICPAAGKCTYRFYMYDKDTTPYYVIMCLGTNHRGCGLKAHFPKYDERIGIIEHN